MLMRHIIGALAGALVLATPATAQRLTEESSAGRSALETSRDPRSPGESFLADRSSGIEIAREPYVARDGEGDVRTGIVGSIPLDSNATIGLGIYKVSRWSPREPDFKKLLPIEDTRGRHQKIAAVGVSLRF